MSPDAVVCQGHFAQAPQSGVGAVTIGDGTFHWEVGNLNVFSPTTAMAYGQTYHRGTWTIYADETGTKFVNDRTATACSSASRASTHSERVPERPLRWFDLAALADSQLVRDHRVQVLA